MQKKAHTLCILCQISKRGVSVTTSSREYAFFLQVLERSGISCLEFSLPAQGDPELDGGLRRSLGVGPSVFSSCRSMFAYMEPGILYHIADRFYLNYLFFLLPGGARCAALGPYLSIQPSPQQIFETAEQCQLSPARIRLLEEFYITMPQIADNSPFYSLLFCLCETLSGRRAQVRQVTIEEKLTSSAPVLPRKTADLAAAMQRLEKRYHFEDELMQAIAAGDRTKVWQLMGGANVSTTVENRVAEPVRNLKNYCIILNTLARKAAQHGGVHPIYLDDLSRTYAERIEGLSYTGAVQPLMTEMADQYCLLVQHHSADGHSQLVQTAMLYVRQHLAESLSLRTVAAMLGCNASYFSAKFKKETGQTLTEFILQERMRLAAQLLLSTQLEIQTIAQHCGFLDANYFSRTFHQALGRTPSEYRKTGSVLQI